LGHRKYVHDCKEKLVGRCIHPLTDTCTYERYFSDKGKTPIISATVTRTQPNRKIGPADVAAPRRRIRFGRGRTAGNAPGRAVGPEASGGRTGSPATATMPSHSRRQPRVFEVTAPCQRDVTPAREDSIPRGPRHVFGRCACTPVRRILAVA
jgi:hypothetical protein